MGNEAIICDGDPRMRGKASRNIRGWGGEIEDPPPPRDQICHKAARTGVGVGFGEGKKSVPVYFERRAARGLSLSKR